MSKKKKNIVQLPLLYVYVSELVPGGSPIINSGYSNVS